MISSFAGQKYRILMASMAILAVGVIVPKRFLASTGEPQKVIHQLRIYEIFDANKKSFHDRFRDHAMRIMAKYDFKIVATWESQKGNRTEFVYLLEWPDEAARTAAWSAFMADAEWSEIKRVTHAAHGLMVGEIEDRLLVQTDYSPARGRSLLATS